MLLAKKEENQMKKRLAKFHIHTQPLSTTFNRFNEATDVEDISKFI